LRNSTIRQKLLLRKKTISFSDKHHNLLILMKALHQNNYVLSRSSQAHLLLVIELWGARDGCHSAPL
jgi:hypothetical protein